MTKAPNLEVDAGHLRGWIGHEDIATDVVSADLVAKFNATFDVADPPSTTGAVAPRFIHFCLTQAIVPLQRLGRDGHPVRGGFMPPVALPRRMRAGGSVALHETSASATPSPAPPASPRWRSRKVTAARSAS